MIDLTLRYFQGINNVDTPERIGVASALNDKRVASSSMAGGREFAVATNVNTLNDGILQSRDGYTLLSSGKADSLFSYTGKLLYRRNGNLYAYPNTLIDTGLVDEVKYAVGGEVLYYTDGVNVRTYDGVVARKAGVPIPSRPLISQESGSLPKGRYMYAITHQIGINEGGAVYGSVDVESGGVTLSGLSSSYSTNIYLSNAGSEELYMVANTSSTSYKVKKAGNGAKLKTIGMHEPFGGKCINVWNNRLFIGSGKHLIWSDAFNYEAFDAYRMSAYYEYPITMLASINEGYMIVGTENGMYRLNPDMGAQTKVSDAQVYENSFVRVEIAEGDDLANVGIGGYFLTSDGLVKMVGEGTMYNRSVGKYKYSGKMGAGYYAPKEGDHRLTFTLR
jgi:hypothetical protein